MNMNKTNNEVIKENEVMNTPVTDVFSKEIIFEANNRIKKINSELIKVEKSYSSIAFNVYWIYANGSYQGFGYKNIFDFTADKFNISKSTTYNFINIVERFGKISEDGTYSGIDEAYASFSFSKLLLMLNLSDVEISKIDPRITVKALLDYTKDFKKISTDKKETSSSDSESDSYNEESANDETFERFHTTFIVKNNEELEKFLQDIRSLVENSFLKHMNVIKLKLEYTSSLDVTH